MGIKARTILEYRGTHSAHDTVAFIAKLLGMDGGPGSGNFGHAGRPGKRGGSAKGSGGGAFRSGSKEGGYTSFANTKAFRGIVSSARASKNYNEFVDKMSDEQRNALRDQRVACGTSENMSKYAKRIYEMLHNRETKLSEIRQKSKPVDGKDISMTWQYQGEERNQSGSTRAIDTDIEDVLHQQGFDGAPKIVSHAEFERIAKEHPEMPILYRSYAASTPDELKSFDNDLERGWFYVDCGTGGAQYGQGMYCAGVYPEEPIREWNETELDPDAVNVLTIRGNGYSARQAPHWMEVSKPDDLAPDYPYIIIDKNGGKHLVMQDLDSTLYENLGEGGLYDESVLEDLMQGAQIYECKEMDIERYEKTEKEIRRKRLEGAMEEMRHYRNFSINRIKEEAPAVVPEGKELAEGYDGEDNRQKYYYDPGDLKSFTEFPPVGELIAVKNDLNGKTDLYYCTSKGVLQSLDYYSRIDINGNNSGLRWAVIEGRCPDADLDPKATTRAMTLDPSAKIITHRELKDIQGRAEEIRRSGREKVFVNEINFFRDRPDEEFNLYNVMMGKGTGDMTDEQIKETAKYRDKNPDKVKEIEQFIDGQMEIHRQANEEAKKYDKFTHMDCGVLAALLGYDAINAEGHGSSDSYTVVLNRTKLIMDEDEVDVG